MRKLISLLLALVMIVSLCVPVFAEPDPDEIELVTFTDVKESAWYYESVTLAATAGIVNGVGNGKFDPNGTVTRGQLVTMLYRIAGGDDELEVEFKGTFSDVKPDQYYSNAVEWAADWGIVNGVGNGKFDPNGKITREQLATILYRTVEEPEVSSNLNSFPDSKKVSSYARNAMIWALESGIMTGSKDAGTIYLRPQNTATRAEAATMLIRFIIWVMSEE